MILSALTAIFLVGGGVALSLSLSIFHRDSFIGQKELGVVLLGCGVWMSLGGIELLLEITVLMKVIVSVKMWIATICALGWTLLAAKYANVTFTKFVPNWFLMSLLWVVIVFVDISSRIFGGYWNSSYPIMTGEFSYVAVFTSLSWVLATTIVHIVAGVGAYWIFKERYQKRQSEGAMGMVILAFGLLSTMVFSTVTLTYVAYPPNFDYMPLGAFIFTLSIMVVFLRDQAQYIQPIKHQNIYNSVGVASIVVDTKFRLVDYNPVAQTLFPWLDQSQQKEIKDHEPFDSYSLQDLQKCQEPIKIPSTPPQYVTPTVSKIHEGDEFVGYNLSFTGKTFDALLRQSQLQDSTPTQSFVSLEDVFAEIRPTLPDSVDSLSLFENKEISCNRIAFQELLWQFLQQTRTADPGTVQVTIGFGEDYFTIEHNSTHQQDNFRKLELLAQLNQWEIEQSEMQSIGEKYIIHNVTFDETPTETRSSSS